VRTEIWILGSPENTAFYFSFAGEECVDYVLEALVTVESGDAAVAIRYTIPSGEGQY